MTGLDGDEAYYWTYSRHLQWGYFDHPPVVALSVKLGGLFGHGRLFTRLGAVLLSTLTIYFGYRALPDRLKDARTYVLVFCSVVIFHIYGFVTTPDPPLFFFTVLFFYAYKLYLEEDDLVHSGFLAVSIVGMLYSKYHGVLPVFFVFLSNPRLVLKRSAWMVLLLVVAAFVPHLWWQYSHGWPTIRYHLFERSQGSYSIDKTTNYILGQLLVFGPFTTIVVIVAFLRRKFRQNVYYRSHLFNFLGTLIFFLLSSFKKNIEPHWTLIAGISFVVIALDVLSGSTDQFKRKFTRLAVVNIVLIVVARLLLAVPGSPAKNLDRFQVQIYSEGWSDSLYKKVAGTPLVFVDNYHYPSIYAYYHPDQMSTSYSTVYFRKSNYTFQNLEAFNNKTVYTVRQERISDNDIEVKSKYVPTFLHKVDSFKAINGLRISWQNEAIVRAGEKRAAVVELSNPMNYTINGDGLFVNYTFFKSKDDRTTSANFPIN
ncbi:MAG: ArnT family glycosyltransferase, partial [Flavisolibacter sp.]